MDHMHHKTVITAMDFGYGRMSVQDDYAVLRQPFYAKFSNHPFFDRCQKQLTVFLPLEYFKLLTQSGDPVKPVSCIVIHMAFLHNDTKYSITGFVVKM